MTGVATDLEDIWLNAIEKHLDIQKKDLNRFKVKYLSSNFKLLFNLFIFE